MDQEFNISFKLGTKTDTQVLHDWIYHNLYESSKEIYLSAVHDIGPFSNLTIKGKLNIQASRNFEIKEIAELLGNPPEGITDFKIES